MGKRIDSWGRYNTAGVSRWDERRDTFLRNNWLTMTAKQIGLAVDMNERTVSRRAAQLKLPNKNARRFFVWTPEKDAELKRLWLLKTVVQIAEHLDFTPASVERRACRLKLGPKVGRRVFVWTPEKDAELGRMWPAHTVEQIAKQLGFTPDAVSHRIRKFEDLPAKRPRGAARRQRPPTFQEEERTTPLEPLEFAPGKFAADQRSYEIILSVLERPCSTAFVSHS